MATERSGAMDIPRRSSDMSPDMDSPTDHPTTKKKKGFQPFKSIKKLFGSKKKGKKDDGGVTGVGIKSTTSCDILAPDKDGSSSQLANKSLSLSADSVFSDKARDTNPDFSRSMDVIPRSNFKDELASRLHRRRLDDSEDDGLPSSPPSHTTTADALIENGLQSMSMDSENSLLSMESLDTEIEEEFFQKGWAAGSDTSPHSTAQGGGSVDLDVVTSTTSLNISAAKHKISVQPKTKRKSTHPGQRRKAQSPKPAGGLILMPQLREESPPKPADIPESEDADTSYDRTETTDDELGADTSSPPLSPDVAKADVVEVLEELPVDPDPKANVEDPHQQEPASPKEVLLRTKPVAESVPDPPQVVVRPTSGSRQDAVKQQTISGDESEGKSEQTVFGQRKVNRSSLVVETRDWDNLGKPKDKSPEEEQPEQTGSEFASVFAKFRRNASTRKTDLDEEAERIPEKKGSRVGQKSVAVSGKTVSSSSGGSGLTQSAKSTEPATRPAAIALNVSGAKVSSPSQKSPTSTKTSMTSPSTAQSKIIVVQKSNGAEKEKTDTLEKARKEDVENVKRSSAEITKRVSVEKTKRESVEKPKRDSAGSANRDSVEKSKRDSVENTKADSKGSTLDTKDMQKRDSVEKESRHSAELKKEVIVKKSEDDKPSASLKGKEAAEGHTTVPPKSNSKFVSVHQKSVPLNDKKSELSSSQSKDSRSKAPAASNPVAKAQTKTVHTTEKDKIVDSSKAKEVILISTSDTPKTSTAKLSTPSETSTAKLSTPSETPSDANKRESPRPTNRMRSQTLPEATVSKTPATVDTSTVVKRTTSEDGGVNKENIPSSKAASNSSPTKPSLVRPAGGVRAEPQKIQQSAPSWMEKARKRTDAHIPPPHDNSHKDARPQNLLSQEEKAAKRASVLDLMKKFQ